jgi:hypothetical protein
MVLIGDIEGVVLKTHSLLLGLSPHLKARVAQYRADCNHPIRNPDGTLYVIDTKYLTPGINLIGFLCYHILLFTLVFIEEPLSEAMEEVVDEMDTSAYQPEFLGCSVCGIDDESNTIIFCCACTNGFHFACEDPSMTEIPIEEWYCSKCTQQGLHQ